MTDGHGEMPCHRGHYSSWLKENHRDVYDRLLAHENTNMIPESGIAMYPSVVPSELHHSRWLADRFAAYLDGDEERPFRTA